MGSFIQTSLSKEKKLSSENAGLTSSSSSHSDSVPAFSPNSPTSSKNTGSLVPGGEKKKVGQLPPSWCENPQGIHFRCKHGHSIYRTLSCHARFEVDCPFCANKWRRKAIINFRKRVKKMEFPAFVTLTLKKPLKHALRDLNGLVHKCRKYLRRKGYEIRGCVSCIEPPNHTHAIWDCTYIPQKELSETWHTVTGDSIIVDIRKVEKPRYRGAVNELAKYITQISECGSSLSFQGVHVITSWGAGGYYKKIRMMCKKCGWLFKKLWYSGQVDDVDNDAVAFIEIDNDYG